MLGKVPFQYENILVTPLNGLYVPGDALIVSWERVNKPAPTQSVSFGVYNDSKGVEWSIDSHNYIQFFMRVPLENDKAVPHWIFDYVHSSPIRKYTIADKLKLYELGLKGKFKEIFTCLEELLGEYVG